MATVPTPLDWVANAGLSPTATAYQAGVRDPLAFLLNPPGAQATQAVAQSIPLGGTIASITFTTEDFDTDSMHDLVTNNSRFTCNTPGRYLVSGQVFFAALAGATGQLEARIAKNGSGVGSPRMIVPTGVIAMAVPIAPIEISLVAGDFIELQASQTHTAARSTQVGSGATSYFRARYVGP